MSEQRTIVVIGGGAAGILATLNLLETAAGGRVVIVEGRPRFGPGVAYSTQDERHVLNVPAARMSAFPDRPDHFVDWLSGRGRDTATEIFVPRRLYADYLEDTLAVAASASAARLERMWGEVGSVAAVDGRYRVVLADRRTVDGDAVVLAIGAPPSALLAADAARSFGGGRYVPDPWEAGALDGIQGGGALLIGTGLTMVDVALVLGSRGVGLHAVSRHGLMPLAHVLPSSPPVETTFPEGARLPELVRILRARVAETDDWRAVIDGLRPQTQALWRSLSTAEQEQFLRHARRYWDAHRHRVAPAVGERLAELRTFGQLVVSKGSVVSVSPGANGRLDVVVRSRRTGADMTLEVEYVVNCTGPGIVTGTAGQPLVRALVDGGLAVVDAHDLGVVTDDEGAVVDAEGATDGAMYAIGALRRGMLWESTAIPELRAQAVTVAGAIGQRLGAD